MTKKNMAAAHKLFSTLLALLHRRTAPMPPPPATLPPHPSIVIHTCAPPASRLAQTSALVVDVEGGLLRSRSLFPYFMLVAVEAGSFLRGLVLLLLYPVIACAGGDVAVRAMAAVAFCGLHAARFRAGRAVLPQWLLEDVAVEGLEVVRRRPKAGGRSVVWTSRMPRVMVEPFLKEYLVPTDAADVTVVAAREMNVVWGFYTGLMEEGGGHGGGEAMSEVRKKVAGVDAIVGFSGGSMEFLQTPLSSICKEVYVVSGEEKSKWRPLPRREYPRPLIFHDGRLAFRPTPLNAVAMLTWLPFGAALAAVRLAVALALPYRYATPLLAATGQSWRLRGEGPPPPPCPESRRHGQLYVCNHRTLIDPVYVSIALDRPVRAVSYSLSRLSELISPIGRTVRLARDRAHDGAAMARLLNGGAHVVVCPEGTTCREPYLLRFSPLFAELSDDVVPVGIAVDTAMFYATTAGGLKCFDPLYYMINPRMCYTVQFLERVDTTAVRERKVPSTDMANLVQRKMGEALGYGCTMLTRKDKYLMLAGNDGIVKTNEKHSSAGKKKK